jgi:tetratricopeptide (TPR) repeat protein
MKKTYWIVMLLCVAAVGCSPPDDGEKIDASDPNRKTTLARQLNTKAADLITKGKHPEAETHLRNAIDSDSFFGPAHNNMGLVLYRRKEYYQAAWEFQYAAKLMIHSVEPRNNLGMVYEAVGKLKEAASEYERALKIEPEHTEVVANLARVYVRENKYDEKTIQLLQKVVMKDPRPEWVGWARHQLVMAPSRRKGMISEKGDTQ